MDFARHLERGRLRNGNANASFIAAKGLDRASGGFGTRKAAEVLDSSDALADKEGGRRSKKARTPDWHNVYFY